MQKERHETTSVSLINYHFVWIVRRRRKILEGEFDVRVKQLVQEACGLVECNVLALETHLDHVHLFINCLPKYSPARLVGHIKGHSSHALREEFPWVKQKMPSLWTRSYYVGTAGNVSSETIKHYVENQKSK
jgi:putative transposase